MPSAPEVLQPHVSNPLGGENADWISGIIGDRPSQYAKTPPLWNAVFDALGWRARSLPFNLADDALKPFLDAARQASNLLGFSVTQPFKIRVLEHLDAVNPLASAIGAVNTVRRDPDGRLTGYNTDGQGGIDALTRQLPGMAGPFLPTLEGQRIVLIGAGGAARAVAFYLASRIGPRGSVTVVNRDAAKAEQLADALRQSSAVASATSEARLPELLRDATLVVNASVKGQAGWRSVSGGALSLEPYSALAPAQPAAVPIEREQSSQWQAWHAANLEDIAANLQASHRTMATLAPSAACFDLIYAPLETPFLQHARFSGHRTLNGKWMNIAQAADGFANKVCDAACRDAGMSPDESYARAFEVMARVW